MTEKTKNYAISYLKYLFQLFHSVCIFGLLSTGVGFLCIHVEGTLIKVIFSFIRIMT